MRNIIANLKMFYKMLISPLLVVLFLLVLVVLAYSGFSNQKSLIHDIFNNRFKNYQESATVVVDLTSVHANLYKIMGWTNANYEKKRVETLAEEQKGVLEKTIKFMTGVVNSPGLSEKEKGFYKQALAQGIKYKDAAKTVMETIAGGDTATAAILMGAADDSYQVLNKSLYGLMDLEKKLSKEKYDQSLSAIDSVLNLFVGVAAIAVIFSLLLNIIMARLVTAPLKEAVSVIGQIAEGDLTQEITGRSRDEIGMLSEAVNQMREKMGDAVGQSVATSQTLSESSSEQAAAIEETSASLEEISAMTRQNAENTNQANVLMAQTKEITEKANGSMAELTQSMKDIAQSSEKTQKIVKTIDEIAFQTNLLALNAAVEAARAGEAGAGFAVVADEVRNLALRAAEAAKNTSGLMEDIVLKVKGGERLVDVTNSAFKQVDIGSGKVMELVAEIAAASREQSQGIDQVSQAVSEMNRGTQQNAASAEELAAIMAMFRTARSGNGSSSRSAARVAARLPGNKRRLALPQH